jgi:hypothetical protein
LTKGNFDQDGVFSFYDFLSSRELENEKGGEGGKTGRIWKNLKDSERNSPKNTVKQKQINKTMHPG